MDAALIVNAAVVLALVFLAVSLTILVSSLLPLLSQAGATLSSIERLSDTLNTEVKPTMLELRGLMDGVNQIRAITAQRVQQVGSKAEELSGNVNNIVGSAKKESTVARAGFLAGLKAYFNSGGENEKARKQEQ